MVDKVAVKNVAVNRKARHDYYIEDTFEAGIELFGTPLLRKHLADTDTSEPHCRQGKAAIFFVKYLPYIVDIY